LESGVDFYWVALAVLKNIVEDIEGADGRLEYVLSLRCRLVEVLQQMDSILSPANRSVGRDHRLVLALTEGISFLDLSGAQLASALRFAEPNLSYADCRDCLLSFCNEVLGVIPGPIPDAQGPLAQRQVLRAMRDWSKAAEAIGSDLSFLEARFGDL